MICEANRKYVDAFVDGELEAGLMLEVEAHLEGCGSCAALEKLRRDTRREIADIGARTRAPEHLRQRIRSLPSRRRRLRLFAAATAVPLAAAAALLLVFAWGAGRGNGDERLAEVVDDVVQRHARELPLEVRGPDPALAASWFRGKVDFPVRDPGLRLTGASFEGARVSNVRSSQAAQMVYTVDGHRVSLMIFPAGRVSVDGARVVSSGGQDVFVGRRNGFNVAVVFDGDLAYAVSSDLPVPRLISLIGGMSI
ncbi:MAG TPA: zf-HC2 domain-containing protein [Polyangia bacterium]|nr:zf-HC2 domain-containing protein [Polyangia bacterium]